MSRTHRSAISYIDKSRDYYAAQGYSQPYKWAATLEPYAAPADPQPAAMATDHLHWHQDATHTNDVGSFLPLDHLRTLAAEGRIGSVSPRYYSVSTIYSQRRTLTWAEQVREWAEEDRIDVMVLVPL